MKVRKKRKGKKEEEPIRKVKKKRGNVRQEIKSRRGIVGNKR